MDETTITLNAGGTSVTVPADEVSERLDRATGEILGHSQLSLSDTLFPAVKARDVPTVKVTVSGTVEITQDAFRALLCDSEGEQHDGGLDAGDELRIVAAGFVLQPGAAWVKRKQKMEDGDTEEWWEKEGRVKLKLTDLGRLELTGEEWSE